MSAISERVREELSDPEYRHAYAEEFLDMILARQIRALRKDRGWSQAELAKRMETHQSRISEIESEEYGALSIATLKDLAAVFDVYLHVGFGSFSELLSRVDRTSMSDLVVPPYTKDESVRMVREVFFTPTAGQSAGTFNANWPTEATRLSEALSSQPALGQPNLLDGKRAA